MYQRVGFLPSWVGYVAVADGRGMDGGAFMGPPQDGVVEIAYYTFEDNQRIGWGERSEPPNVDVPGRGHVGVRRLTSTCERCR